MQKTRVLIIFFVLTLLAGGIFFRALQLQIFPDRRLAELQRRQYNTLIDLPSRRGVVTDRKGKELAITVPAYSIFADPKEIESQKAFSQIVGKKLGLSPRIIREKIKDRSRRFVWIKRQITTEVADTLRAQKLRGLGVIEEAKRVYPNERLLSQVLGFVGREGAGLEGIEKRYDDLLKGEGRKIRVERDARGRPLLVDGRIFADSPAGYDLQLTIDADLQFMLEKELSKATQDFRADSAVGVILDARTSEVLAMSNYPTFDPNSPSDVAPEFWRNRALTDAFEPGSTIKTLVIAGGLLNGIKPSEKFFCENGLFKLGKNTIREADVHHKFGQLTMTEILAQSSNIGTTKIALKLGAKKIDETLRMFGLGGRSGIDLPGEGKGVVQKLPWRDHLLANISFGHGLTATPLQIATAYLAIANGGVLRSPFIVKSATNHESGDVQEFSSANEKRILSPEQAQTLRLMLNAATSDSGTGKLARVPGFPVGGKTGTAQKVEQGRGYSKDAYISSFAGFIPVQNPRFVVYVAVDNPREKYYGSEVAAPVFAKIAGYAVRQAGISPVLLSEKSLMKKDPEALKQEQSIAKIREMAKVLSSEEQNQTPNFSGLTLREVLNRVRGTPIQVEVQGRGVVSMTEPAPGEPLPEGKKIRIFLGPVQ